MKLVSTALTKAETKKRDKNMSPVGVSGDSYPWGVSLDLDDDLLKKLGLDPKDFGVGGKVAGRFEAEVTDLGQHKRKGGVDSAMRLQIVRLGFESGAGDDLAKGIKAGLAEGKGKS